MLVYATFCLYALHKVSSVMLVHMDAPAGVFILVRWDGFLCLLPVSLETDCNKPRLWQGGTPKANSFQHTHLQTHTHVHPPSKALSAHVRRNLTLCEKCVGQQRVFSLTCVCQWGEGEHFCGKTHNYPVLWMWSFTSTYFCQWIELKKLKKRSLSRHAFTQ